MASFLANRSIRSRILRLPPELRSTTLQSRPFSNTPSRKLTLVDIAVAGPNAIIDGIHSLGIPWYATLPLTAALVRGTLVYYLSAVPARKKEQVQALLLPLVSAKIDKAIARTRIHMNSKRPGWDRGSIGAISQVWMRFYAARKAWDSIGKHYGAPRWSARSSLNFGMLIAFTEAIRLKCGAREGLLPLLISPFQWTAEKLNPETFPPPPSAPKKDPAELYAERLEAMRQEDEMDTIASTQSSAGGTARASEILNGQDSGAAAQIGPSDSLTSSNVLEPTSAYFDPSMTTEGLAWFTNLTLPDSTIVFPTALGISLLASIAMRPTVKNRASPSTPSAVGKKPEPQSDETGSSASKPDTTTDAILTVSTFWQRMTFAQRFGVFFSGAFALVAMKLPVAILLYFIPTVVIGFLQSRWLSIKYPIPQPIKGCARPLRMKQRKEWHN